MLAVSCANVPGKNIYVLRHQVHLNHVGLNAPEKLKPEKISTKYKKPTCTNKKKRNRKKSQALKQVCLRRQKKIKFG
jgi:hypothetical protein